MLGDGIYNIMIDSGIFDFDGRQLTTQDCVPRATYIQVNVGDRIPGTGHDEYRGYAMLSEWKVVGKNQGGDQAQAAE